MGLKEDLVGRLKRLTPGQFEEMAFRCGADASLIRDNVTQVQRAIDLVRLMGQEEAGLGRLNLLLDELDCFQEFLPEGAFPVGERLRDSEEARESQLMQDARARGDDPEDYRVTPEDFYTFRNEAAWLGVFRGWDAPRPFYTNLLLRVVSESKDKTTCPSAAIIGPGSSGKSVALRRMGIELAAAGHKVWWVEEPERFLRFGLSQLREAFAGRQFLLVDDIQDVDDPCARRFQRDCGRNTPPILVVAGRELPSAFRAVVQPGDGVFIPNEAADRAAILEKISEVMPSWRSAAAALGSKHLRKARLIQVLLVLARQAATPANLRQLEGAFWKILASDIDRIRNAMPGLAEAVMHAAVIREVGHDISRETLISLVQCHQPGEPVDSLLRRVKGNPRWQAVSPLMSYDAKVDAFRFHHDELAEGLLEAGRRQVLPLPPCGDEAWKRATLDLVMRRGSERSKSWALSGFLRSQPRMVSTEQAVRYLRQLVRGRNSDRSYLQLVVDEGLGLQDDTRRELLLELAEFVPAHQQLWGAAWAWVDRHCTTREQRAAVLDGLHMRGCRDPVILVQLLRHASEARATALASDWLQSEGSKSSEVLCACLQTLGEGAKGHARRLLTTSNDDEVLFACLKILGPEAAQHARQVLNTTRYDAFLQSLCRWLKVSRDEDETRKLCHELMEDAKTPDWALGVCLDALGEEAKHHARQLVKVTVDTQLLCACLRLTRTEPETLARARNLLGDARAHPSVLSVCLGILGKQAREDARRFLQTSSNSGVLCASLRILGDEAKEYARGLLSTSRDQDVLCRCLYLLKAEAAEEAEMMLATEGTSAMVLSSCVSVLGAKAATFIASTIRRWVESDGVLVASCFRNAGETPEARDAAYEILLAWDERVVPAVRAAVLRTPFHPDLRRERAHRVLASWQSQWRHLVTVALTALEDQPAAVTEPCCKSIVARWRQEMRYQNQRHWTRRYDSHLITALSHPDHTGLALTAARQMLAYEETYPGFLTDRLRQEAGKIVGGEVPVWGAPRQEEGSGGQKKATQIAKDTDQERL